jgi:hypothetical protein
MVALNFPSSPTVGDTYNVGSRTWTWTTSYATFATRTNLVPNPNFETNVLMTENTSPGGSSLARSTAQFYSGVASCAGSTGGTGGNLIFGTMSSSSRIAATAGTVYTGSLYARSAAVQRTTYARLLFYNAGGTGLSTTNGTSSATSTTAWTRYTVTETAPANTATVVLQVVVLGVSTTETHYIDGVLLETGSSALPYFDGTYADAYSGYTLTSQSWSGTANASASTATWGLNSSLNSLWTVNAGALSNGVVGSNELAAGAVTTAKIATNAITATTLASSPTNNYILTADSATATGTKWATAQASGGLTTSTEGAIATMAIGA